MSMIRSAIIALIALSVLTVPNVSHAETPADSQRGYFSQIEVNNTANTRDIECLANNIYHEARGEPKEGQVAVGLVTINRSNDKRFPKSICGVIHQKYKSSCQFSWVCRSHKTPSKSDKSWLTSYGIAKLLITDQQYLLQVKQRMGNILYFHERRIRPYWASYKVRPYIIGSHMFYGN